MFWQETSCGQTGNKWYSWPCLSSNTAMLRAPTAFFLAASFALASCAGLRDQANSKPATAGNSKPPVESKAPLLSKLPKLPSLAGLLPGPRVKVVEVREKDLKKLPSGHERALAFESGRKGGFWFFNGPVDFKEPTLPDPGSEMDGSLLPPRVP